MYVDLSVPAPDRFARWLIYSDVAPHAASALITNQKAPPCALLVASKRTRDWLPGTNRAPAFFAGRRRSVAVNVLTLQ